MKIEKYVCDRCREETTRTDNHHFWLTFKQGGSLGSVELSGSISTVDLFRGGRARLDFCSLQCFESYLRLYAEEAGCSAILDTCHARWSMLYAAKGTADGRK